MARPRKLIVDLTPQEKKTLEKMISSGTCEIRKAKRAQVLLLTDIGNKVDHVKGIIDDEDIAAQMGISRATVGNIRRRFYSERLGALEDLPRPGRPRIIDGEIEAQIIAIACSDPPEGRSRWTLRLLADRLVEVVDGIDHISYTAIGKALKKTNLNLG